MNSKREFSKGEIQIPVKHFGTTNNKGLLKKPFVNVLQNLPNMFSCMKRT